MASSATSSGPEPRSDRALERARVAAQAAADLRGRDVVILDLRKLTSEFDYFVLATGTSQRQLHAMSDEIDHKLQDELRDVRRGVEGYQGGGWVLLDYGDVVVHLFGEEERKFYALEDLWGRAPRVPFTPAVAAE